MHSTRVNIRKLRYERYVFKINIIYRNLKLVQMKKKLLLLEFITLKFIYLRISTLIGRTQRMAVNWDIIPNHVPLKKDGTPNMRHNASRLFVYNAAQGFPIGCAQPLPRWVVRSSGTSVRERFEEARPRLPGENVRWVLYCQRCFSKQYERLYEQHRNQIIKHICL